MNPLSTENVPARLVILIVGAVAILALGIAVIPGIAPDTRSSLISLVQMCITGLLALLARTESRSTRTTDAPPVDVTVTNKPSDPVPTTDEPAPAEEKQP